MERECFEIILLFTNKKQIIFFDKFIMIFIHDLYMIYYNDNML